MIEPSTAERAKLPECSAIYMQDLETEIKQLQARLRVVAGGCRMLSEGDSCTCELCTRDKEIERLEAIVGKLPVDQNGDPILPNTTRYFIHPRKGKVCKIEVDLDLDVTWTNYDDNVVCHSRTLKRDSFATREAAEAAGGNDEP